MASLGGARKAKEQHQFAELCAKEFLGKGSRQRQTDRQTSSCRLTLRTNRLSPACRFYHIKSL